MLIILSFTNCNDWLDVNPRQEIKESELYKTEEGYKSALIGSYLLMGDESLYGKNTSMYVPELLVHHWTLQANVGRAEDALSNYDYTQNEAEYLIDDIWSKYYNVIVHLNNLLGAIDENVTELTQKNSDMIKGEALGLRAFLHLELLRYFGPVPQMAVPNVAYIPYVTAMTKDPNQLISKTWTEIKNLIESDLNQAETLLKNVDPLLAGNKINEDEWYVLYRENRFNYYSVLASKARYYQWIGDQTNAVKYAEMVVEAKDNSGSSIFKLSNESSYAGSKANLIMYSEIIFGIHNPKLQNIVKRLFANEYPALSQSSENIAIAYESAQHPDDIRNKERRYWEEKTYISGKTNHYFKYTGNEMGIAPSNVIPLIRLSEMYFILIENLPYNEAIDYFTDYRIARSMSSFIDNELTNKDMLLDQLEKEYRKEFFAEGQMFFFYKRNNAKTLSWPNPIVLPDHVFNIPLPKSQTSFE